MESGPLFSFKRAEVASGDYLSDCLDCKQGCNVFDFVDVHEVVEELSGLSWVLEVKGELAEPIVDVAVGMGAKAGALEVAAVNPCGVLHISHKCLLQASELAIDPCLAIRGKPVIVIIETNTVLVTVANRIAFRTALKGGLEAARVEGAVSDDGSAGNGVRASAW